MKPRALASFACVFLLGGTAAFAAGKASTHECVMVSADSPLNRSAADAAMNALGKGAVRIDLDGKPPAALASQCERGVVAIGRGALKVALGEIAPGTIPLSYAMVSMPQGLLGERTDVHGMTIDASPARMVEILQALHPNVKKIGAVYDPASTGPLVELGRQAATGAGIELVALPAKNVAEAIQQFHRFEKELDIGALWFLPDTTATTRETVAYGIELAHWKRIPAIGLSEWYVSQGALFALTPRAPAQGTAAVKMLREREALESEAPTTFDDAPALYLSGRAADRLGLKIPAKIRAAAVEVMP